LASKTQSEWSNGSARSAEFLEACSSAPRIELLKLAAIEANQKRDKAVLALVIRELEQIWRDDRAACRFYTMLEETAP
jgi:hypothetical protein